MYHYLESEITVKILKTVLPLLFFYNLIVIMGFSSNTSNNEVFGHALFGNNSNILKPTQTIQNENYIVDLYMNPPRPLVDKVTNFSLEIKSMAGDSLIELPVSPYILKENKSIFSNPNNYTLVQQQHYDFRYTFNESGPFSLVINIKDIFYSLNTARFNFEIFVDGSVSDKIVRFLGTYYYIFLSIIIIITISIVLNLRRKRNEIRDNM